MASEGEGGEDLHWKLRVVIMNFVVNKSTADCDFHHPPCWQWRQGRHYGKCWFSLWISLPINHAHVCFCGGTRVGAGVEILWLEEFTPEDISIIDKIRKSHNTLFRTEMCTFLFWIMYCGIWDIWHADFTNPPHYHQNTCQKCNLFPPFTILMRSHHIGCLCRHFKWRRHNSYTWQYTIKTK